MNFKEIFERYKNGNATEDECKYIEEEIEKNELITEYLSESFFENIDKRDSSNSETEETKNIQHAVNKKFRKSVFTSVITVGLLIAVTNFIILPAYNSLFYNPNKGYKDDMGVTQFFIDVSTFTDLHFPGYITDRGTSAESLGFGKYNIRINQSNTFKNDNELYNNKVVRNKIEDELFYGFYKFPPSNAWIYEYFDNQGNRVWKKEYIRDLQELPESSIVSANVSFKKDITLDELIEIQKKFAVYFQWAAIRGSEKIGRLVQVGLEPNGVGPVLTKGIISEEDFPCFDLGACQEGENDRIDAEDLTNHFKSSLKYMTTRGEFLSTFADVNFISPDFYRSTLEYVNINGVNSYGVLVQANVKDLLEFLSDDIVYDVRINDVKLSAFSR